MKAISLSPYAYVGRHYIKTNYINKQRLKSHEFSKMQDSVLAVEERSFFPETKQSKKQPGKLLLISFLFG